VKFRRVLTLILVCLVRTAPLAAQHYTFVSGLITDASGASVPGAMVSVINEDTGFRRSILTQSDGGYVVSSLEPGVFKITVRKDGFHTMIRFGVKLSESQPARVDFKLVVGSVQETITVEGSVPLLASDDAAVSTLVGRDRIERLPISGGSSLLTLLELAPGVVVTPATRGEAGQFTVNGQRPNTHYFTVDGASANSGVSGGGLPAQSNGGALPGMTAFGSMDNLVSIDALQEMRVQTSTTVPEFGRLPGAQISLTSRSGSNELHGSLLYAFRNEALGANDWFARQQGDPRAPQRLYDFAATLGGALRRNRTFFFLSYEGMRLSQSFVSRQAVPSLVGREDPQTTWVQPLLTLFPEPNGPDLGKNLAQWTGGPSRPARLDVGAVRLDQAITSRLTAFARYSETPSSTQFGSSTVDFLDLRSRNVTTGLNFRPTPYLVLDLRVNFSQAASDSFWQHAPPTVLPGCYVKTFVTTASSLFEGDPCASLARLSLLGSGQVVFGPEGQRSQSQFHVNQTVQLSRGTHNMQFGADYRRLSPSRRDAGSAVSVIANSLSDLGEFGNLWRANAPLQNASGMMEEVSLFAADTWRVTSRLTATYGLRLEISPAPVPDAPVNFLDPQQDAVVQLQKPLWGSTYTNFAPRIGLAYRLSKSGRTVVRAGAGYYYDSSLSLATDLVNDGPLSVSQYFSQQVFLRSYLEYGFLPNLRLPLVKQWNATIEHALGDHDVVSVGYAGSSGGNLIRREMSVRGDPPNVWLALATNHGSSDYHSLEAQYRRRMARGLQALVSYAWSHSIDNSSTDAGLYWTGPGVTARGDRAASDFDVRHSFTAGFTYESPASGRLTRGWAVDGMFRARTGFPINVLNAEQYTGVSFENIFRPDLLPGQQVWIDDPSAPGGRRINREAFPAVPKFQQGNLGRNALSGFGMSQLDLAVRREFFRTERRSLQLRIEAFNALNHSNFADPVRYLSNALFGQSTSMLNVMLGTGSPGSGLAPMFQAGGARSVQVAVRLRF
jgi:hypothetical protein